MILLDALHMNDGGGKILLDYLISEFNKNEINVFFLLDKRCENDYGFLEKEKVLFLNATLKNRLLFYLKNSRKFKIIFCFANIPPLIKTDAKVYTYLHQFLFETNKPYPPAKQGFMARL